MLPAWCCLCRTVLQALKAAFTALMTCDADKVSGAISSLVQRLSQESEGGRKLSEKEQLVLRLNTQYPNDVGVLSAFFLNQVRKQEPGAVLVLLWWGRGLKVWFSSDDKAYLHAMPFAACCDRCTCQGWLYRLFDPPAKHRVLMCGVAVHLHWTDVTWEDGVGAGLGN